MAVMMLLIGVVYLYQALSYFAVEVSGLPPLGYYNQHTAELIFYATTLGLGCAVISYAALNKMYGKKPVRFQFKRGDIKCLVYVATALALATFFLGVQLYGGYFTYMATPYDPVMVGKAENGLQQVAVATGGLFATFGVLYFVDLKERSVASKVAFGLSSFVLLSLFLQGRREYVLLLVFSLIMKALLSRRLTKRLALKYLCIALIPPVVAGIGLSLRGDAGDVSILVAIVLAVGYETHFTVATLANQIYVYFLNHVDYSGFHLLFKPLMFMVPRFVFFLAGVSKDEFFTEASTGFDAENKGGAFIFCEGFRAAGFLGVAFDGVLLGIIVFFLVRLVRSRSYAAFYFPVMCMVFVLVRKDVTMSVKYVSLFFIMTALGLMVSRFLKAVCVGARSSAHAYEHKLAVDRAT